ncbi:MAG: T9SS type A sorting domain-containing protein [Chitinophagales bacterium]|nr:T9SS type A sorting domain-containing protein [Chitinophagales bacterium]MDW8274424.1 T9SS type A sorting domain-containing protein [Chitinophagales bacterium]
MRFVGILSVLLSVWNLFSQKWTDAEVKRYFFESRKCKSSFTPAILSMEGTEAVQSFILKECFGSKVAGNSIQLAYIQQSPGGRHYSFFQKINNVKVYSSELKVNTDGKGTVTSFFDNSFHPVFLIDNGRSADEVHSFVRKSFTNCEITGSEPVWLPVSEDSVVLCFRLLLQRPPSVNLEVISDGEKLLCVRDRNMYAGPIDTFAKGYVFLPDPLTSSGNVYGGIFVDNNDADAPWLNNQRFEVSLLVEYDNNTFKLKNKFVEIADFDSPNHPPATAAAPSFYFTRSNLSFEQVNALYHITEIGKRVKSLGFNCADVLVEADANALSGQDNSFFATNYSPMRLYFGTGGVDDAEDADVCIHEYSHFLSYNAAPESNSGTERQALDEGFCDYMAASYSRSINDFNWGRVYNWDGHNTFWNGRVVNSAKKYPNNLINNIYRDGEIWSSMLMQLWSDLGRDKTDKLILQTHYGYAKNISYTDAANLFLIALQQLYNNDGYCIVAQRMQERGVLPPGKSLCSNNILEDEGITLLSKYLPEGFLLTANKNQTPYRVWIYDLSGRVIREDSFDENYMLYAGTYPPGMYVVLVKSSSATKVFKWTNSDKP